MGLSPLIARGVEFVPATLAQTSPPDLPPGHLGLDPLLSLLITLGLSLVPTLLFVGLWRGLMYLRDDDLIEEVRRLEAQRAAQEPDPISASATYGVSSSKLDTPSADAVVVCEECHTRNVAGMAYCWDCLSRLPKE